MTQLLSSHTVSFISFSYLRLTNPHLKFIFLFYVLFFQGVLSCLVCFSFAGTWKNRRTVKIQNVSALKCITGTWSHRTPQDMWVSLQRVTIIFWNITAPPFLEKSVARFNRNRQKNSRHLILAPREHREAFSSSGGARIFFCQIYDNIASKFV